MSIDLPVTRYACSGELNIAYQTMGNGPIDLILIPGMTTHVEFLHEIPGYTDFLGRLAAFTRIITFDKSGQGLSAEPSASPPSNSAWTTSAPVWMTSDRRARFCSDARKARRSA